MIDFTVVCAELEHQEILNERKETRRHQSLGEFCAPDETVNIYDNLEQEQIREILKLIKDCLSKRQFFVFTYYAGYKMSFREIGDELGLHKDTIREHYHASVKKLQKFLKKHPVKLDLSWLLGEGSKSLS